MGTSSVTSQSGVEDPLHPPHTCKGKKETQREVSLPRAQGTTVQNQDLTFFADALTQSLICQSPSRVQMLLRTLSLEPYCRSLPVLPASPNHFCPPCFRMGAHPPTW